MVGGRSLLKTVRRFSSAAAGTVPPGALLSLERWARGREDCRLLRDSDYAIVSYPKSGRTWLNVILSKCFQLRYDLPDYLLIRHDNLHRRNPSIPTILFTHDSHIRDYTRRGSSKAPFYAKPTMLLIRHPADTAISLYFHWRHRMQPGKTALSELPAHGTDIALFQFVMREFGLPRVVRFLNEWAREIPRVENLLLVRYEDLRVNPHAEVGRMLRWMAQDPSDAEIASAVEFASFENLKQLEARDLFRANGSKGLSPGDRSNPDSFKVRRAKVNGYCDYFDADQVREIEDCIRDRLDPALGYGETPPAPPVGPMATPEPQSMASSDLIGTTISRPPK